MMDGTCYYLYGTDNQLSKLLFCINKIQVILMPKEVMYVNFLL